MEKLSGITPVFNRILFSISFVMVFGAISAQTTIDWDMLAKVSYETKYDEEAGFVQVIPQYGPELKGLDGKEVLIKGYVLPMDVDGKEYMLSAFPYSSCFFCGGAGRESVIELRLANDNRRYKMDDVIIFKGNLILNTEPFGMNYLLQEATPAQEE